MYKISLLLICTVGCLIAHAQDFHLGGKTQKTYGMYWENGLSAQYSFAGFYPGRLHVGLDYYTTRLGSAIGSNALKQDNLVATTAWYFRKDKAFRLLTKLNMGIFKVDLETEIFDELPSTAFVLAPELGVSYRCMEAPWMLNLATGYNLNFQEEGKSPGTYQPLFYNLSLFYNLFAQ